MPPSSNTVWPLGYYGQASLLAYWRAHVTGNGLVVKVNGMVGGVVDAQAEAAERLIERTPHFTLYREP